MVAEAKRIAERDDIRQLIIQEANRLSVSATGDVKPEAFEDLFEKELRKYYRLSSEMEEIEVKQKNLLEELKVCSLIAKPPKINRALTLTVILPCLTVRPL